VPPGKHSVLLKSSVKGSCSWQKAARRLHWAMQFIQ